MFSDLCACVPSASTVNTNCFNCALLKQSQLVLIKKLDSRKVVRIVQAVNPNQQLTQYENVNLEQQWQPSVIVNAVGSITSVNRIESRGDRYGGSTTVSFVDVSPIVVGNAPYVTESTLKTGPS